MAVMSAGMHTVFIDGTEIFLNRLTAGFGGFIYIVAVNIKSKSHHRPGASRFQDGAGSGESPHLF